MKTATIHIPLPDVSVETTEQITTKRNGVVTRKITETPHGIEYMNTGEQRTVFTASANVGQSVPAAVLSFFADCTMETRLADYTAEDKETKALWRETVRDYWQHAIGKIDTPPSFGTIQSVVKYNLRYNLIESLHSEDGMVLSLYVLMQNRKQHAAKVKLEAERKQAALDALAYEQQAQLKKVA